MKNNVKFNWSVLPLALMFSLVLFAFVPVNIESEGEFTSIGHSIDITDELLEAFGTSDAVQCTAYAKVFDLENANGVPYTSSNGVAVVLKIMDDGGVLQSTNYLYDDDVVAVTIDHNWQYTIDWEWAAPVPNPLTMTPSKLYFYSDSGTTTCVPGGCQVGVVPGADGKRFTDKIFETDPC